MDPITAALIQIAISIATSLLISALTPGPKVEGPRLKDLKGTTSAYGWPIPVAFGTVRLGGNCIWQTPIEEVANTERIGKGGGGSVTTYTYFWTGAVMIAEGEALRLVRIWADTKLIADYSEGSLIAVKEGVVFRFYTGSDTQMPDPAIVADVDAREGENSTPAYRGRCYVVFDRLPLADFGNRVPQFSFEVMFAGETAQDAIVPTNLAPVSGMQADRLAFNWQSGIYYTVDLAFGLQGIRKYDISTQTELLFNTDNTTVMPTESGSVLPWTQLYDIIYLPNGRLYVTAAGFNTAYLIELDPGTMTAVGSIATTSLTSYFRWLGQNNAYAQEYGSATAPVYFILGGLFGGYSVFMSSELGTVPLTDAEPAGTLNNDASVAGTCSSYGTPYLFAANVATEIWLHRLSFSGEVVSTEAFTITRAQLNTALGTAFTSISRVDGVIFDRADDNVIIHMTGDDSPASWYFKVNLDTGAVMWGRPCAAVPNETGLGRSIVNGQMVMPNGLNFMRIDTITGDALEIIPYLEWQGTALGTNLPNGGGFYVYNGTTDAALSFTALGPTVILFSRASPEGVTLASIVSALSTRTGILTTADIDVSALTDMVPGYVIDQQMPIREAVQPLALAYFFDACESDDIIKFRKLGGASLVTIPSDSAMVTDDKTGQTIEETREQEMDLPERAFVVHFDRSRDYQQGTQHAKRISNPQRTGYTRSEVTVQLPIVMQPDTAKQIAQKALYSRWVARDKQEFRLPRTHLLRDPIDVVTLSFPDHAIRSRLEETTIGADLSIEVRSVAEEPATFVSDATADGGYRFPQSLPAPPTAQSLYLIDAPYLRDQDAHAETSTSYLFATSPTGIGTAGAFVFQSADGASWTQSGSTTQAADYGTLLADLPSPASVHSTDFVNSIRVAVARGTPASVSVLDMRNGANPAIILDRATGEVEVLQYRDAAQETDGSWTLRVLRRGARGTDGVRTSWSRGATVIFPSATTVSRALVSTSFVNAAGYFKAVPSGGTVDASPGISATLRGRDLSPWAPNHLTATESAGDIVLTWKRRTRYGGAWLNDTGDVPLNQESERYEVDIYSGSSVVRTLTATASTVTYTAANIAADFGSTPASLRIAVYQIGQLGRGFKADRTLNVA